MKAYPRFFGWLAIAATVDWLIGRTLVRSAIFMPKSAAVLWAYQVLGTVGQAALTVSALLAYAALLWIAWRLRLQSHRILPAALVALTVLNVASLFIAPSAGMALAYHLLALAILLALAWLAARHSLGLAHAAASLLPASALIAGEAYKAAATLPAALRLSGPSEPAAALFNLGEALVVAAGVALGLWLGGRPGSRWVWPAGALPALGFALMFSAQPSLTGVLAIWSIGLTLFLPWPTYAVSLGASTAAWLAALRDRHPAGLAIPLLVAGGYAPQLSSHLAFGLIALYLLASAHERRPMPVSESRAWLPSLASPEKAESG